MCLALQTLLFRLPPLRYAKFQCISRLQFGRVWRFPLTTFLDAAVYSKCTITFSDTIRRCSLVLPNMENDDHDHK